MKKQFYNRWKTRENEILDFLSIPRSHKELREFLQLVSLPYSKEKYIMPLVREGKIQLLYPESKTTKRQKYISTASQLDMVELELMRGNKIRSMPDRIVEICNKPRTVSEISKMLHPSGLKESTVMKHINWLLEYQKLTIINDRYIRPDGLMSEQIYDEAKVFFKKPRTVLEMSKYFGLTSSVQSTRYIKDFLEKGIVRNVNLMSKNFRQNYFLTSYIDIEPLTEQGILDYCRIPRRSTDVTKHFGICGRTMMFHYMDELVKEGKLQHTVANEPRAERRLYITAGGEFNIFSIEALLEYCKTPRRSKEIFTHFSMNAKKLFPFLDDLMKEGKLIITTITQDTSRRKYMTVE